MSEEATETGRVGAIQAVERAIDILEAVAEGPLTLPELVERVGLPKTTCYRLAKTLADRGLLSTSGRSGYRIGPLLRHLVEK